MTRVLWKLWQQQRKYTLHNPLFPMLLTVDARMIETFASVHTFHIDTNDCET